MDCIQGCGPHDFEWLIVLYNTSFNIKLQFITYFPSFGNGPINRTAILIFQDGVKLHDITVSFVRGKRR